MVKKLKNNLINDIISLTFAISASLLTSTSTIQAQTGRQIAQNAFPSVALLVTEDSNGQPLSLGSGFFVGSDIVATAFHVIEGASKGYIKIVGQKRKYEIAGIVGSDAKRDLVLLKITGVKAPPLSLGDANQVAVGDEIYVISNPQGLEGTLSQGIVSGIRQIGSDILFQITAPISPGSSGGPVLNSQGKVIGIAVATFTGGQNLNFAIPVSYLTSLLSKMKPLAPLSTKTKERKSVIDNLGKRNVEGIKGGQLSWTYPSWLSTGEYSFSLRNHLNVSIKDVYCLVIFYDRHGNPIDYDIVHYDGVIPAGLAKRVTSEVDGSVQELTKRVEFRILDFKVVE
jgi:V8-like Glu-specific endopeptidase